MAEFDRQMALWLILAAIGIGGFIVAFLGEFVFGWWHEFGEWLAWATGALSVIAVLGAAGRFQLRDVATDVKDIKRNTAAIPEIERNTAAIPEAVALLRQIRDRLPPP